MVCYYLFKNIIEYLYSCISKTQIYFKYFLGNITRSDAPSVELNPKIYLLNVMNYTWVNTFDPKQQSTDNNIDTTQQDKIAKIKTEIGIICGVIGSVVIIVIIFFINKWKKRDKVTLRIPGEETLRIPSEKRL